MSKQRRIAHTKANRIEWTVTRDKEIEKAIFYIVEPQYHGHIWTACAAARTSEGQNISTYAFRMDPAQTEALTKALGMASRWAQGKRLSGRVIEQKQRDVAEFAEVHLIDI